MFANMQGNAKKCLTSKLVLIQEKQHKFFVSKCSIMHLCASEAMDACNIFVEKVSCAT